MSSATTVSGFLAKLSDAAKNHKFKEEPFEATEATFGREPSPPEQSASVSGHDLAEFVNTFAFCVGKEVESAGGSARASDLIRFNFVVHAFRACDTFRDTFDHLSDQMLCNDPRITLFSSCMHHLQENVDGMGTSRCERAVMTKKSLLRALSKNQTEHKIPERSLDLNATHFALAIAFNLDPIVLKKEKHIEFCWTRVKRNQEKAVVNYLRNLLRAQPPEVARRSFRQALGVPASWLSRFLTERTSQAEIDIVLQSFRLRRPLREDEAAAGRDDFVKEGARALEFAKPSVGFVNGVSVADPNASPRVRAHAPDRA